MDRLRGARRRWWAIPVSLIATLSYIFAMSVCATIVERGGPAYLNLLVLLFAWNAVKFAATGVLIPTQWSMLRLRLGLVLLQSSSDATMQTLAHRSMVRVVEQPEEFTFFTDRTTH